MEKLGKQLEGDSPRSNIRYSTLVVDAPLSNDFKMIDWPEEPNYNEPITKVMGDNSRNLLLNLQTEKLRLLNEKHFKKQGKITEAFKVIMWAMDNGKLTAMQFLDQNDEELFKIG